MRGKAIPFSEPDVNFGITPAYAGKSQPYHFTCTSYWDHPRVCGEKQVPAVRHQRRCGSPPRMRGKVTRNGNIIRPWGITPAYAGKRHVCSAPCKGMGDHPRVCGEKASIRSGSRASQGSPPRMRGKGDVVCRFEIAAGITPAYAGKRLKRSHSIGHFSCILCLFHSVLHRASVSDGSRAGPCAPPCLPAQNAVPV